MSAEEKSNVLNLCLKKWPKAKALVYVNGEKISAVLSGSKFRPLPQESLLSVLTDVLKTNFKGYKFTGAYLDHTITKVDYELPASSSKILDAYRAALLETDSKELDELSLAIQFITSDIGQRGAVIHCYIIHKNRRIPLGFVNGVDHMSQATVDDFRHVAGNIFAAMQKNVDKIKRLLDIKLVYPENAMLAIAKKEGMPKVAAMEAVKMFSDINRGKPTSAHNVYYALNEIIYLMNPKPTERQKMKLEDKIAGLLSINWKSYDMALPVKW